MPIRSRMDLLFFYAIPQFRNRSSFREVGVRFRIGLTFVLPFSRFRICRSPNQKNVPALAFPERGTLTTLLHRPTLRTTPSKGCIPRCATASPPKVTLMFE